MEIAESNNLSLLQYSGKQDLERCGVIWDEIVKECSEAAGSNRYNSFLRMNIRYWQLVAEYISVKAMLDSLTIVENEEYVSKLHKKGYHIRRKENGVIDQASIEAAKRKSEVLVTKILSKQNEIEVATKDKEAEKAPTLFDLVAHASKRLGYHLPNDILLAEYNAYVKQIKADKGNGGNRRN